jgi:hypothetical protein
MTREEIVTALRCCAFNGEDSCEHCTECPAAGDDCESELQFAAADLIENQQREIEALRWANEGFSGDEICRAALEAFGERAQMTMAIEEMSELAKELCKRCRGRDNVEAIAEEIADVEIINTTQPPLQPRMAIFHRESKLKWLGKSWLIMRRCVNISGYKRQLSAR